MAKECVHREDDAYAPNLMHTHLEADSRVLTDLQQDRENKSNDKHRKWYDAKRHIREIFFFF